MYSVASSTTDIATLMSNAGIVIAATITVTLVGYVALLGLGFGVRHLRHYITGRKF